MKIRLLPLSLFTLILGCATLVFATTVFQPSIIYLDGSKSEVKSTTVEKANPVNADNAKDSKGKGNLKSGSSFSLNWKELGPDNIPGRFRAVLFDNKDASGNTIIAANVNGGLFKSTNSGLTWSKIDSPTASLNVSCMMQMENGDLYAGTGESFCTPVYTLYGGLLGQGLWKSTDGINFNVIPSTVPVLTSNNDTVDWAYINEVAFDKANSRLYAATNTGLMYSNNDGQSWERATKYISDSTIYTYSISIDSTILCDSILVEGNNIIYYGPAYKIDTTGRDTSNVSLIASHILNKGKYNCTDVAVSADGTVAASWNHMVYIAGSDLVFRNNSVFPTNTDSKQKEYRTRTITKKIRDKLGHPFEGVEDFTYSINDTINWDVAKGKPTFPSSDNPTRVEFAFAPSDPSVLYACVIDIFGYLKNLHKSNTKGESWEIVFPGNGIYLPFNGAGCWSLALAVSPTDPDKVFLGGNNLWIGKKVPGSPGYYDWGTGPVSSYQVSEQFPFYLPRYHHSYVFNPANPNKFVIGTNRGVYYGTVESSVPLPTFQSINKRLNSTEFYSVGLSGSKTQVIGGAQGNGYVFISGYGNTNETGTRFWQGNGGFASLSLIDTNSFFIINTTGSTDIAPYVARSEDKGLSYSVNFNGPANNQFVTPFVLWENFNHDFSRDSVTFYATSRDYTSGEVVIMRSHNNDYPFDYVLPQAVSQGDSLRVKDIVQSRFFLANRNEIYMTKGALVYNEPGEWFKIAAITGIPISIAVSADGNYCFVGTTDGKLYRISNLALAYNYQRADVGSPGCIVATDNIAIPAFAGRQITSVSVDPQNPSHIMLTLGGYGKQDYVYRSTNALDSLSVTSFTDITGNLPKFPVYSSLIEMSNSNTMLVGTEHGVFSTENPGVASVEWTSQFTNVGAVPVYMIKQQTIYKPSFTVPSNDPFLEPEYYPEVKNFGCIYIATHGRGIFMDESFFTVGSPEGPEIQNTASSLSVYPNPVTSNSRLIIDLKQESSVNVQIFNINGTLADQFDTGRLDSGRNDIGYDFSRLTPGTYIVKVKTPTDIFSSKFVVIR